MKILLNSIGFLIYFNFALSLHAVTGSIVEQGTVDFKQVDKELRITASDGSVISYDSFNIAHGETVRFEQPTQNSSVINKVRNHITSQIDGNLIGNGKVYILSPGGIIFGEKSVVEVNKLYAIAGYISFDDEYSLIDNTMGKVGTIDNRGKIVANEVVLAGYKVSNSGSILVEDGILVLGAGGQLSLVSENSDLQVSLKEVNAPFIASDVAGHAILNSGIVEASKTQLAVSQIKDFSSERVLNNSSVSSVNGAIKTNELDIQAGNDYSAVVDLSSSSNQISQLEITGSYNSIKIRSLAEMSLGEKENPQNFSSNHLDLRVSNEDLNIYDIPVPKNGEPENSVLLGSDRNLNIDYDLKDLSYARMILFGSNLTEASYQQIENKPSGLVHLLANSITLDELEVSFSATFLQKLALENEEFFAYTTTQQSSSGDNLQETENLNAPSTSEGLTVTEAMNSSFTGLSSTELSVPQFDPLSQTVPFVQNTDSISDEEIFDTYAKYKLFDSYSYYLQAAPFKESTIEVLSEMGGASSLFGGSYATLSSGSSVSSATGGGSATSGVSEDGGDSQDGEESESSDSNSNNGLAEKGRASLKSGSIRSVVPFSPISMPIASFEAASLLNDSLSEKIELKLQKYIK
jgi:filamentous hemagglutinin family protein